MSDNISQCTFDVIWDDLMDIKNEDNIKENENEVVSVVSEISFEEFERKFGFDARIFETSMTDIDSDITVSNNVNETSTVLNNPAPVSIAEPAPEPIPVVHPEVVPTNDIPEPISVPEFRDVSMTEVHHFIADQENKNTAKKTLNDIQKFTRYLAVKGESRPMHQIEVEVLDDFIASDILSLRRKDGTEFEPVSLRGMISSLDRQLRRHRYPFSIMNGHGPQFNLTRETYNAKKKSLKKQVNRSMVILFYFTRKCF